MHDGITLREHYQGLAERTGRSFAEIANLPEVPPGCEWLWRDFSALSAARGSTGFGPSRISWAEIDAYQRMRGLRFEQWELDAITRADMAFVAEASKRKPKG